MICGFAVMMLFTGCSKGDAQVEISSSDSVVEVIGQVEDNEVKKAEEADTVTVIDQLGREVTIEGDVERIVSSYYVSSAVLIALEAEDKVVGIEMKADTREIYKAAAPQFLDLPAVGSGKTLNIEEILALDPDVVIIPYRLESFIPQLEALDIPVIAVQPETMEDFLGSIDLIGKAIGHEEQASELRAYHQGVIESAKKVTEKVVDKPVIYLAGSDSVLKTCTANMYQNDLIELAGGINASADLEDHYWAIISAEQLLAYNPAYIYTVGYAEYTLESIREDARLASVDAVMNDRLQVFPSSLEPWDYPTPSSALGILWLTHQLHPELYTKEAYMNEAKTFYEEFYDIEVTDTQLGL